MVVVSSPAMRALARADAGWSFTLVPAAAEGGGSFRASLRRKPEYVARGQAADPERDAMEAARRARTRLRRYCAANVLNRLGTLGPPPSFGPVAVRVVGFQLMGALPSVVDRCEVSER